MNNISVSVFFFVLAIGCHTPNDEKKFAVLQLKSEVIDLGIITSNDSIHISTKVYNTGTDTLKINKIGVSCGCTSGQIDKKNIMPGDSSVISLSYSPVNDSGKTQKNIIIENNSSEPFKLLKLQGVVAKKESPFH